MTEIAVHINARNLPSAWCRDHGVTSLGLSRAKEVVGAVSTDEPEAEFDLTVDVVRKPDALDFRGPCVFGKPGERFLYLNWTGGSGSGRIKLQLVPVDATLVEAALEGGRLVADLDLTGPKGGPVYASVRPPALTWRHAP
ncbi:DUF5990 family protein [Flindersiella endophytica]